VLWLRPGTLPVVSVNFRAGTPKKRIGEDQIVGFQGLPRTINQVGVLALALAALLASTPTSAVAGSQPVPVVNEDAAAAAGFSMNLYKRGDFTSQYTPHWCIGASMQMMANMVGATNDDSHAAQRNYMVLARTLGRSARRMAGLPVPRGAADSGLLRGAGSTGWAQGLEELGAGRYEQVAFERYDAAVKAAADALRRTRRPVGLIVWRGAHAWVMSGFTATADPLVNSAFRVTGVYVLDPWYPRVSSIWGPGQKPNTWVSVRALKADFLARNRGRWQPELEGKWVLVAPVAPVAAVAPIAPIARAVFPGRSVYRHQPT
jgi:hypothetical protein